MRRKVIVELKKVHKHYKMGNVIVKALNGVSLKVKQGEFISIMGPSGSGKSTLMHLVGCLDLPTQGKVLLDGRDISRMNESSLSQLRGKKVGFVFQTFNLLPSFSALGNVALPMVFQGTPHAQRQEKAKELLTNVGLGTRMNHKSSELSGGERQRVALARALANNPKIVLADEPTGNLDTKTGKEIMKMLKKFHESGKTIILVTHDEYVAKYAEKIIQLKDGKIFND